MACLQAVLRLEATFLWSAGSLRGSQSGLGLMTQVGPGVAQLVGPGGPILIKSLDFWTTKIKSLDFLCLDSLERFLKLESIGHVTRVELFLLRENWIVCILDPVPRESDFSN